MKKIKLFVDGHWFDDPYESAGIFMKGLYKELQYDERFHITVGAFNLDRVKAIFDPKANVICVPYASASRYYRLAVDIPRLLIKHRIDLAHYQYTAPLPKITREIVTIHDILFKDHPELFPRGYRITKNFLFRRSARRAELVTTVSGYSRDAIMKHFGVSADKISVVPNGMSEEFFIDYRENDLPDINSKYHLNEFVLYVSRIEPRKNHLSLVKAYVEARLAEKGIKLVFIGRTDIKISALDNYISQLPTSVQDHIVMLRNINFRELISFYRNAALFVYPSIAEGFGIPPLEAAALKTRTLCSNSTAMADFAFFGEDLFDPCNVADLATKIQRKLNDKDSARREKISNEIKDRYNWRDIASEFADRVQQLF